MVEGMDRRRLEPGRQLVSRVEGLPFRALVDGHPAEADDPPVAGHAQTSGAGVDAQERQSAGRRSL